MSSVAAALDGVKAAQIARGEVLARRGALDKDSLLIAPGDSVDPSLEELAKRPESSLTRMSALPPTTNNSRVDELFNRLLAWARDLPRSTLPEVRRLLVRQSTFEPMTGLYLSKASALLSGQSRSRGALDLRYVGLAMKWAGGGQQIDAAFARIGEVFRAAERHLAATDPACRDVQFVVTRNPYSDEIFVSVRPFKDRSAALGGSEPSSDALRPSTSRKRPASSASSSPRRRGDSPRGALVEVQVARRTLATNAAGRAGYRIDSHRERVHYRPILADAVAPDLGAAMESLERKKTEMKKKEAELDPSLPPPGVRIERVGGSEHSEFIEDSRLGTGGPTTPLDLRTTRELIDGTLGGQTP